MSGQLLHKSSISGANRATDPRVGRLVLDAALIFAKLRSPMTGPENAKRRPEAHDRIGKGSILIQARLCERRAGRDL